MRMTLAAGFAIALLSTSVAAMDCKKASTRIESEICADAELSKLDTDLGKAYQAILAQFPRGEDQSAVKQQQRHWLLRVRNLCLDKACLSNAYQTRIAFLQVDRYMKDPNAQFMGLSKEGAKTTALGRLRVKAQSVEIEMLAPQDVISIAPLSPGAKTVLAACKPDKLCQVTGVVRSGENMFYTVEYATAAE